MASRQTSSTADAKGLGKSPAQLPNGVRRIGITVVHQPNDGQQQDVDIVLVHGLFGHPKTTWTPTKVSQNNSSEEDKEHHTHGLSDGYTRDPAAKRWFTRNDKKALFKECFWPRDLLPKVFPKARIMTWGYDVDIDRWLSSASQARTSNHAESLLLDLDAIRPTDADKATHIIFIAHSFGGVVVKDALNLSNIESSRLGHILAAAGGVLFLGTPHRGSKVASLGKLAFEASRFFLRKPNCDILRALETNNELLERISKSFAQILTSGKLRAHSFWEELPTNGISIVERHSGVIDHPEEACGSLYANHKDMARYSSADDVNFGRIVAVLKGWVNERKSNPNPRLALTARAGHSEDDLLDKQVNSDYLAVLDSLNISKARGRFREVENPYLHTFDWMFHNDRNLSKWLQGQIDQPFFWIHGKPGSGKSTAMKFAACSSMTQKLLEAYDSGKWMIIKHFFHDRGLHLQKSLEGLLREILFQVLSKDPTIFTAMYQHFKMHSPLQAYLTTVQTVGARESGVQSVWTIPSLQDILHRMQVDVIENKNICLFIDALDEHEGDPKALLSTLDLIRKLAEDPSWKIRACVASRPDNIFKQRFRDYPDFAMHKETVVDIRTYVEGRIQEAVDRSDLNQDGLQTMQSLIGDIINRAQGIFLWVRLVVDELLERLSEGDTFAELSDRLSTIPLELRDLYTRALLRKRHSSSQSVKKESYAMFRIASSWHEPWELQCFLTASLLFSLDKDHDSARIQIERLSAGQMRNRLYSRSCGLLEVPSDNLYRHSIAIKESEASTERHGSIVTVQFATVQFIHQTLKDWMVDDEGRRILDQETVAGNMGESGTLLIFRYFAHVLHYDYNTSSYRMDWRTIEEFIRTLRTLENEEGFCVGAEFEDAIENMPEGDQIWLFRQGIFKKTRSSYSNKVISYSTMGWNVFSNCSDRKMRLVHYYVAVGLHLSLERAAKLYKGLLTETDVDVLFKTAIGRTRSAVIIRVLEENFGDLPSSISEANLVGSNEELAI